MSKDIERIEATDPRQFREWLEKHHATAPAVWLVYYKKDSGTPSITWSQAVDEALCYGWIDSKSKPIDQHRYEQYFTPRNPKSPWSKVNKNKIKGLIRASRVRHPGLKAVSEAQDNGSWTILDDAENHIVPEDLAAAFPDQAARDNFEALTPSRRRNILQWIVLAKREETRSRRIAQTAQAATNGTAPNNL
ncbi:MAG: YdeI/OmpD-associated family protein [Ornithinimicrobium sp.]